jgi:hypothetical protein
MSPPCPEDYPPENTPSSVSMKNTRDSDRQTVHIFANLDLKKMIII